MREERVNEMITPIEVNEIPKKRKMYAQVRKEIERFWVSGWDACEIDTTGYKSTRIAYNTWRQAASHSHIGLRVILRGARIFLIRGEEDA